ncbi:MAG: CoA pyrophosphatase [Thaumarchaeota archaeon]|nr:CoA pyrophosphatase [Nitrososphaerota archaeon]
MADVFSAILKKLDTQEPPSGQMRQAAVSMMLKDMEAPSVLLIKRADREGDPWSGQVAFPGGKAQEGDATLRETAIRETNEEVGIDLGTRAEFLGYFSTFRTHTGTMDVVPAAFLMKDEVEVRTNDEVASYRWVKLERLLSGEAKSAYRLEFGGQVREMPALLVDDYVVWGLTHLIISTLLE